ncbi:3346_t:CDS:1, partial [Dentiscutata erythropus]
KENISSKKFRSSKKTPLKTNFRKFMVGNHMTPTSVTGDTGVAVSFTSYKYYILMTP